MSNDKSKSNRPDKESKPAVFRLGGREIREGDSLSPKEAEEFVQRLIEESGGPVTIEEVDESTGMTIRSSVDNWSEFKEGPKKSEEHLASFRSELARKGYLAFDREHDDSLSYHTKFRALGSRYFTDFDQFIRCQDIPDSYFVPVLPSKSWFVSHRWATPTHPDPSRTQFQIAREFMNQHQAEGIWYDYSCMPQEPHSPADGKLFADSLKHLNSLIITTNFLSIESNDYLYRAWCYYERIICELLCCCKRGRIHQRNTPELSDDTVHNLVVEGKVPNLKAEKASDRPLIENLLVTGVDMFKMLAISTTFEILNTFGFQFGVGTASRFSRIIDFEKFWMIWRILAGSSEGSGIRLPHLLNADRLRTVLVHRHERFDTHARFFADLRNRIEQPLDMRIVEQGSASRLAALLNEVSRSGPVPDVFSKLALIQLVYWIAGRDQPSS